MSLKLFKESRGQVIACLVAGGIFMTTASAFVFADVAVVANKGITTDAISKKEAKKIFLGKTKSLGGTSLMLADLPKGDKSRDEFYTNVVKKNGKKLKAYWAKIVFSGKGSPPKSLKSDEEMINWVASTPGGMGYVNSLSVNDSVKVLLKSP